MTSNDKSTLQETLARACKDELDRINEEIGKITKELGQRYLDRDMVRNFGSAAQEMIYMNEVSHHTQAKISMFKRYVVQNPSCLEEVKKLDRTGIQLLSISFSFQGIEKLKSFKAHHVQAFSRHIKSQPAIDSRLKISRVAWRPFTEIYCQADSQKRKYDDADDGVQPRKKPSNDSSDDQPSVTGEFHEGGDLGPPSPTDSFETLPSNPSLSPGQPTQQWQLSNILNPRGRTRSSWQDHIPCP